MSFRAEVRGLMEWGAAQGPPRSVVVFGIDGLAHRVAADHWNLARNDVMESVFPTTSSAGWLSALTGREVDDHGVPGFLFRRPGSGTGLTTFLEHDGPDLTPASDTVFTDARSLGYLPKAVLGDLSAYPGPWRDALTRDAEPCPGHRIYTAGGPSYQAPPPERVGALLRESVLTALEPSRPSLVWCFVELDQHVHRHGYDAHVSQVLAGLQDLAVELVERGAVVLAHSDHGLVPTRHDPVLERFLTRALHAHGASMGGAGRVRWLYVDPARRDPLLTHLERGLPSSIDVTGSDTYFAPGSLARSRVGDICLIAGGEPFLTSHDYTHDHGSLHPDERRTPLSLWR
ncbi:alkaline phosphatase family protein [Nocardiopsis sp. NPDC101807]|uniref:alkaline phosphatase family protein n=1 Tax=Nocardiopsis sp. NPDC101807 TaxID=3364339 RepID=UPI00380D700D